MIVERIGSYFLFIQGFRSTGVIDSENVLGDLRGSVDEVDLQLLRADRVAGKEHIIFAARNAVDSFRGEDRRAKHLSMELLLFASGEHQIVEAIKLLGIDSSSTELVLVGLSGTRLELSPLISRVGKMVKGMPDDTVLDIETTTKVRALRKAYNISDRELDSSRMPREDENEVLKRLVIERSALLVLEN
ncbi:MAG TPA: KEOPS complex subunit Cgi121 [Candidatus Bathyarchaeia archaeon]|nr:KEOPS complex subunit Cgi121 [Candidatus Bathyarchaeia archaeon]